VHTPVLVTIGWRCRDVVSCAEAHRRGADGPRVTPLGGYSLSKLWTQRDTVVDMMLPAGSMSS
jgi:hypothetical protein